MTLPRCYSGSETEEAGEGVSRRSRRVANQIFQMKLEGVRDEAQAAKTELFFSSGKQGLPSVG